MLRGLLTLSFAAATTAQFAPLVDLFIGTGSDGNAFPGAAVPNAMAKVGIDMDTSPRQAGYKAGNFSVTGISLMHDEGTGGNAAGGWGVFPLFPLANCDFTSCPVTLAKRKVQRTAGDAASPGYFSSTLTTGIHIEATTTRRAGLVRFTYPAGSSSNLVVVDLSNDLQRSFRGGSLSLDPTKGRIQLQGTFLQSYGTFNYTAFGCYDFLPPSGGQSLVTSGTYNAGNPTVNTTSVSYAYADGGYAVDAGALLSLKGTNNSVTLRFGISMHSTANACANAETEVPDWDWDAVHSASEQAWENRLSAVSVDTKVEDATVLELLYSSLYRAALVPANFSEENPYSSSQEPFYDSMFCSWDTFRTEHPLISLLWPRQWAEMVRSYIDGWRAEGFIPECRVSTKAGYIQGGSNGMPVLGDFAVKYADHASDLQVNTDDLYTALVTTAEETPSDWYRYGRQNDVWKRFGYIPFDRCTGTSKANGKCTTAADCGDTGLSLCGSDGFQCLNNQCKKKTGAYCAGDLNECLPNHVCANGDPYIGSNYKPKHCSPGTNAQFCTDEYTICINDTQPNPNTEWCAAVRDQCIIEANGGTPDGSATRATTGLATREVSRSLEYAFNDFAVAQAARALDKSEDDVVKYTNRSLNFKNLWDASVNYDGFTGYMQKRFKNGTFIYTPPDACSPVDSGSHSCARGDDNDTGFYESSSFEYSFWAPHSVASLVSLMGGAATFIKRLDRYFAGGYFLAGNEPSFETPWLYHYANRPDLSAARIRQVVYQKFGTSTNGIPGNDDSGAMAALLVFHLLGLYPIPATRQLLLGSPFVSSYTLRNDVLGTTTTVSVKNFDRGTLNATPAAGTNLFVQSITVNGEVKDTVCWLSFDDLTGGGNIEIAVGSTPLSSGCGSGSNALPESVEDGGVA
ncbi:glycoside hydrolase family 92 protein [Exidia glandulosa HHB12029]|uniref:Glycoside hydrolase family 92 protein n=1 Tax=Exidia glandulosa HHB12029 TaxID=1314781 RepID=A0A165DFK2_EXIGL|nr:glycoside hydrolase family 92 protein [Exidia glandulosa HHB12029]